LKADVEVAESLLIENPLDNWYLLSRLASGKISECDILGGSVRLLDSENGKHLYAVDSFQSFQALYEAVRHRPGPNVSLVTRTDFHRDIIQVDPTLRANAFNQLLCATSLPIHPMEGIDFLPIQEAAIPWILEVYQHPELNPGFIKQRIIESPTCLALKAGTPVGFILSHCDAELGPVYVAPTERGTGLATQLLARVVPEFLKQGIRPGMFVSPSNTRSYGWLKRIGCTQIPHQALWFWRESTS
jgi:GNAT superfamily N-acetyltransferase